MKADWQDSLKEFFEERAGDVNGQPTFQDLCFVSGRDYRIWQNKLIYEDAINSILHQAKVSEESQVLEMGCAAGFLAYGIAPKVKTYIGVDLAKHAVLAAKKLGLVNAKFQVADGTALPFSAGQFDAVICYDVFTNIPSLALAENLIAEMLRVVKPGGYVLVGSLPDGEQKISYEKRVLEVSNELNEKHGPAASQPPAKLGLLQRIKKKFSKVEPGIVCYYFTKRDFVLMSERLGANICITDIHSMNPYHGFRFNALFTRT